MSAINFQEVMDGWLARAENPAIGMEAELWAAREKIKQLEHNLNEKQKVSDVKEQEQNIKIEMMEKVIMAMAGELQSLQEGNEPQLSMGKTKALEKAQEGLMNAEKEKDELAEKLDKTHKTLVEVIETRNTLMKVVESVGNNVEVKKTKKSKAKIPCREFNKPDGCSWGHRCRFQHGEEPGLGKDRDCSYWMMASVAIQRRSVGINMIMQRRG